MPCVRHRSATFRPASPSLTIAKICSSVNLLRFIGPPLKSEDPHSMRGGLLGAGQVARDLPDAYPGQVHGGLFLSLSLLAGSAGQLVERPRVRIALAVVSLLLTVMA